MRLASTHQALIFGSLIVILSACAPAPAPALPDVNATVEQAVAATQTAVAGFEAAVAAALAATQTAEAPEQPAATEPAAAATEPATAPIATDTPAPDAPPSDTPTSAPECTVLISGLRLRSGPGLVYEPPLGALAQGARLAPLAAGPQNQWVQVQVVATGQAGWVSAGVNFVACNINVGSLPPGVVPPTPTPAPTATPVPAPVPTPTPPFFVILAPQDRGDMAGDIVTSPGMVSGSSQDPIFRRQMFLRLLVRDPKAGNEDGAGIKQVDFTIFGPLEVDQDRVVHRRTERVAGYCSFGGGEPDCNVLDFARDRNWPDGGPEITSGRYRARAVAQPSSSGRQAGTWEFEFEINLN